MVYEGCIYIIEALLDDVAEQRIKTLSKEEKGIGKYEGSARTSRKRCACYKRIQKEKGSKAEGYPSKFLTICKRQRCVFLILKMFGL